MPLSTPLPTLPATLPENDPRRAGQVATSKQRFGAHGRFAVYATHTRFDALEWFVADAYGVDDVTGGPAVVRQGADFAAVLAGLEDDPADLAWLAELA